MSVRYEKPDKYVYQVIALVTGIVSGIKLRETIAIYENEAKAKRHAKGLNDLWDTFKDNIPQEPGKTIDWRAEVVAVKIAHDVPKDLDTQLPRIK